MSQRDVALILAARRGGQLRNHTRLKPALRSNVRQRAEAAPRGRVVEISATGKRRVEFDLIDFYHNETHLIGADSRKRDTVASARLMTELAPGFETGLYKPSLIAERYPLSAARDAYRAVVRGTTGRVVLTP